MGVPSLPLILGYHKIERRHELGATRIGPRRFARQVERLLRDGWRALSYAELARRITGAETSGPREFAITFDDAYRGLREHAFPVLESLGVPSVCFAITEYAGRLNRWDVAYGGRRFAHLAWRDMRRWQARGVSFHSHSATHARLTWMEPDAWRGELAGSRAALERELGVHASAISYPFGAWSPAIAAVARECGYDLGFALAGRWTGDPMAVTRLPVYAWTTPTPGRGPLAWLERAGAVGANRCAVGTTIWQRWRAGRPAPAPALASALATGTDQEPWRERPLARLPGVSPADLHRHACVPRSPLP
jgi:peptidoglycan/xylan/chitin deacetylase (PgdA/CDA1 family)